MRTSEKQRGYVWNENASGHGGPVGQADPSSHRRKYMGTADGCCLKRENKKEMVKAPEDITPEEYPLQVNPSAWFLGGKGIGGGEGGEH